MTNLLRRALRRLLDFAYRLDREAMWQQWEAQYVQPLRGQVEILNKALADLKDDRDALQVYHDRLENEAASLKARLSEACAKILDLTKDHSPAWDDRNAVRPVSDFDLKTEPPPRKPWYRR